MRTALFRHAGLVSVVAALLGGVACGGPEPAPELPQGDGPPDWITEVVRHPDHFASLLDQTGRDGWVAFHANDLRTASVSFVGDSPRTQRARSRVEAQLALLYGDLARASDYAHMAFLASWSARELPMTPAVQTLSAQWRSCGGLDGVGVEDIEKLPAVFKTEAALVEAVAAQQPLHEQALEGSFDALYAASTKPWLTEREADFERKFYDPCVYGTLGEGWLRKARRTLGADDWRQLAGNWGDGAELEGRLFAPWLTARDLESEIADEDTLGTVGASQPSLVYFGVSTEMSVQDDIEVAREDVRALDAAIDLRERALLADGDDDGDALLKDLGLHHRFRQEWIAARARKALLENRPHQAMAYLELARDVSTRVVGPANTPSVLALYAEAQIRLGRTREALDVLVLLEQAHPEVVGLKELTGDLAVLQGLDRHGDSKEN